ncbi:uncharacterized protein LOC124119628 [Haliotis rufescens]|uniref:uncharacterized protein LOC124119628 n=1 Tax=Haliotis rufescens TaxID=6454 RepID=UPI001EB09612|nr:uncharacterized protein LOC124119628 [Haliotis rufescens]XP_048255402.1 uncharacterized protein LOC124119628 [Haliotis rufescens]
MNWESKFSSIVQETEANLAKVKQKLRSKANLSPDTVSLDYTPSPLLSTSLGHYPASSTPRSRLTDRYGHNMINSNIRQELTGMPQSSTLQLQEKIEEQNATISRLSKSVQSLEKERGEYQNQIQMLRSELSELSSHVLGRGSGNPHLEWQMDQIKRDLKREVKDVRDQLQLFRTRVDHHSTSDHTSFTASRDLEEVRQDIQEELRYIRKDLDVLRRRVGSVEMDVMGAHYDKRDLERSQDRMNKSLHEITNGRTRNLTEILKTCPDADRSLGHTQLEHLRSTVRTLKDKLNTVDARLNVTSASPHNSNTNSYKSRTTKSYRTSRRADVDIDSEIDDDDLDLDDLSDLEDSDTEPLSSNNKYTSARKARKTRGRPDPELSDSDDDVDVNEASIDSGDLEDDDLDDIQDLHIDDDDDIDDI